MLVWNAILKNERAIIDRCVNSLLPHVDGAVVVDTGSTDGTPERVMQLFAAADKPVEFHYALFENFSQARNEALRRARESKLPFDYLLLSDADMELVVTDPDWTKQLNGGLSYDLQQIAGSVRYVNRRVLSRRATGNYLCPTHEYLDVESAGILAGAEFNDHADGSNRSEKFQRDIDLLEKALETETNPGLIQRYHFYLGQSFFDAGNWTKAAEHYKIRTTLGGFDEEVWNAQLHLAHALGNQGDDAGFIREMLKAYQMRPSRAETLYDLAKYFRERGENETSLLFSEAGMQVKKPNDVLFVNGYVYDTGLREEFSICAWYDVARRARGAKVCNELALKGSEQARFNQYWYLQPLVNQVPSFMAHRIGFEPPEGYVAMNPSVINRNGQPVVLVRTVNYTITPEGTYAIRGAEGHYNRDNPINSRNWLLHLDGELTVRESHELALPPNWPDPKFDLVRGFEDSRLFEWNDQLYAISTVRELTPEGWCEAILAPITERGYGEDWKKILPEPRQHQKNWMPWVRNGALRFVHRLETLIDTTGRIISQRDDYSGNVGHISGGSQVIQIDERIWIALVHEARSIPGRPHNRYYQHRFVSFLSPNGGVDCGVDWISPPFCFHDRQIEFAAGLALFGDKLMVSYGVRDQEGVLATMDKDEVIAFIYEDSP